MVARMTGWSEPLGLVLVGAMFGCSVSCLGYAVFVREVEPRVLWALMAGTFLSLCLFAAVTLHQLL